jgi:RNA 3'-terminal phosphate cyclase
VISIDLIGCSGVMSTIATTRARAILKRLQPNNNDAVFEVDNLRDATAVGSGCGQLVFATTDTGCVLGASALGEKGVRAEQVRLRYRCQ